MKYQRILFVLSVPILVLLFIAALLFNWRVNYVEFQPVLVGLALLVAVVVLALTSPMPGRPSFLHRSFDYIVQAIMSRWPYVQQLSRDMDNDTFGLPENCGPETYVPPSPDTAKSQRTLAFSAGGPAVAMLNWFKRAMLMFAGIVGSSQPRVARVTA